MNGAEQLGMCPQEIRPPTSCVFCRSLVSFPAVSYSASAQKIGGRDGPLFAESLNADCFEIRSHPPLAVNLEQRLFSPSFAGRKLPLLMPTTTPVKPLSCQVAENAVVN